MNAGRWYPTTCMLSNGEVVVDSGQITGGQQSSFNTLPQIWKTTGGRYTQILESILSKTKADKK